MLIILTYFNISRVLNALLILLSCSGVFLQRGISTSAQVKILNISSTTFVNTVVFLKCLNVLKMHCMSADDSLWCFTTSDSNVNSFTVVHWLSLSPHSWKISGWLRHWFTVLAAHCCWCLGRVNAEIKLSFMFYCLWLCVWRVYIDVYWWYTVCHFKTWFDIFLSFKFILLFFYLSIF